MKQLVSRAETVDFVAGMLAKHPGAKAAEITKAGKAKGLNVYPLIFGLARKQLGIGPKAKTGRGPGRPRKVVAGTTAAPVLHATPMRKSVAAVAASSAVAGIEGVITHMRSLDAEVTRLRGLLTQIGSIAGR